MSSGIIYITGSDFIQVCNRSKNFLIPPNIKFNENHSAVLKDSCRELNRHSAIIRKHLKHEKKKEK
jgi:hypothetical protein